MRAELVVDAANVVGSRPDGWWRDRPGAADRLVTALAAALRSGALTDPVAVILEGAARSGVPPTPITGREVPGSDNSGDTGSDEIPGLRVLHAPADGDSAIVAEVTALVDSGTEVTVVTADRGLRARVTAAGAQVVGPSWLRDRLP
ncbi:MAG TPA: hypothetical protein VH141_06970 [Pseudonocardia sp.]|jgi:hypothetical protein|nr:hypothetical protein [Pseudonocardia sp.]